MNTDPINPDTLARLKEFPKSFREQLERTKATIKQALLVARALDWVGKASDHEPGTEKRALAEVRDEVDRLFAWFTSGLQGTLQVHAMRTLSEEALTVASLVARGDGRAALEAVEREYELFSDESTTMEAAVWHERARLQEAGLTPAEIDARNEEMEERAKEKVGKVETETLMGALVLEAYARVEQAQGIARRYPKHVAFYAKSMPGWPMVVRQHLDGRAEFAETVDRVKVGAAYPLDVSWRKKRGTDSPMLRYLDPLIVGLDDLHCLRNRFQPEEAALDGFLADRWDSFTEAWRTRRKTAPEVVSALRGIAAVGRLTKGTARDWTTKVLVPLIMVTDARTPETCEEPALQNIWRHEAVKSPATFKSRLYSQVLQTLERYAWAERPDEDEG